MVVEIMKTALHPTKNESIDVPSYIDEFGPKLDQNGDLNERPLARCPACDSQMHTKGEVNPAVDGVFSHQPDVDVFCPLKISAEQPYIVLDDVEEDRVKTKLLRSSFLSNWKYHYTLMKSHLKVLSIFDFIKLIKFADKYKIWSYRHIEETQLPFIFLALKEFPPVKNKEKKYIRRDWVRFWFDSRVRNLNDLWISTDGDWLLIKAIYANPRSGGIPSQKQLKTTEIIRPNFDILGGCEPKLPDFVMEIMQKEFGV